MAILYVTEFSTALLGYSVRWRGPPRSFNHKNCITWARDPQVALSNRAATSTKVLKKPHPRHLHRDQAEMQADYFVSSFHEKVSCKLRGLRETCMIWDDNNLTIR
jgi:hypothetical protein